MAPPKFGDLNKQVSDIFNKGYCSLFPIDIFNIWFLFLRSFQCFQSRCKNTNSQWR